MTAEQSKSDRVLVVIDMDQSRVQEGNPRFVPGAADCVRYIAGELKYFRERGRPIFFCQSGAAEDGAAEDGAQQHVAEPIPDLLPRSNETVLLHPAPDAFFTTELEARLRAAGARRLTLVGAQTCTEVLLTAASALARDFVVVVPQPCACSNTPQDHAAAMRLIHSIWQREPVEFTGATQPLIACSSDPS